MSDDKCKCNLRESMLGDGCKVCQPRTYIAKIEDAIQSAESEIEQLEQELAEALAAQAQKRQWISVEERLPEKFVDVLVHPRPTDYICEAAWLGDAWYWSDYELNFGVITNKCVVTHWMLLPKNPTED